MKPWARYLLCALAGIAAGSGAAMWSVRSGAFGAEAAVGQWRTGTDLGTADASAWTRASVALHGLLALPAREARYYSTALDDKGRPLDGRCRYRITGTDPGGRWFSLTLYDTAGYLVANPAGVHSVGSAGLGAGERASWSAIIAPRSQEGRWLPTGGVDRFNLTFRVYLPQGEGSTNLARERLPRIERLGCP